MELGTAGLREQPFRVHGRPLVYASYEGQREAQQFLLDVFDHPTGLGIFLGPALSGKTTIIRHFAESLGPDVEIAIVDGSGLNTTTLLEAVLSQFGYRPDLSGVNELINMLKVFLMQRTASLRAPMLVIENTHAMNPSALRVLCELAELKVRHKSALRLVLASDRSIEQIINAPAMERVSKRVIRDCYLAPMTVCETTDYIYEKLQAGGCTDPGSVIPELVCDEFHTASGGWPGIVDRLVLLALAKAPHCPIDAGHVEYPVLPEDEPPPPPIRRVPDDPASALQQYPELLLSHNGERQSELLMKRERIIIGRSEHNDLQIDSKFVSRHHALLIRNGNATFLMDLNSSNGTFVNSRRVSNQVLMHDDVITLGSHNIKFKHQAATGRSDDSIADFDDTVIMKSMVDMRRMLARENTQSMPMPDIKQASGDSES